MEAASQFEPTRLTQPSKVELVLEAVRRGILRGELRPGEPLSLARLSGKFGISPGPLREAHDGIERGCHHRNVLKWHQDCFHSRPPFSGEH